jgi:flavorubredoxin
MVAMARLLVVHHTPSPSVHAMTERVIEGTHAEGIEGVEVVVRPALVASAIDVLEADAYVLGTPANLGYMSGALKHFFDLIYYPCLDATANRPYGLFIHGNNDTEGARRAIDKIVTGLRWQSAAKAVCVTGEPSRDELDACWELGATVAAGLTLNA